MQGAYILNIFKTHSSSLTTRKSLGHSQKTLAAKNPQTSRLIIYIMIKLRLLTLKPASIH